MAGVGFALRKIATGLKPDVIIEVAGDTWTVSIPHLLSH